MSSPRDLALIDDLPPVKLWGEDLDMIDNVKSYRGKFVVTADGKIFAKLYPLTVWEGIELFHDTMVKELGIKDPESMDVKEAITGGGRIDVDLKKNGVECRLHGKSTVYGDYEPETINTEGLVLEIQDVFGLDEMPVRIVPDYEP